MTADLERDEWDEWADLFGRHARGHYNGKGTAALYLQALGNLTEWARASGKADPVAITSLDLERYFAHFRERKNKRTGEPISGAYMKRDYVALRQFYKYVAKHTGERNPMDATEPPRTVQKRIEILADSDLERLLATCKGREFTPRRDTAILRVLIDTGARRQEISGLKVADVDLDGRTLLLTGKGGKTRRVGIGHNVTEALAFYLRARAKHRDARIPALWLADPGQHRGALGSSGLASVLRRRASEAGVDGVHPHRFRHTAYNALAQANVDGTAVMTQFGWSSRSMLDHYAQASAEGRAVEIIHRVSVGDRV